jgi:hypothetical protein
MQAKKPRFSESPCLHLYPSSEREPMAAAGCKPCWDLERERRQQVQQGYMDYILHRVVDDRYDYH